MTTSTITRKRAPAGFTLAEVMISATISTFVLAGVLSSFLLLGRSGANLVNYTTMDAQTRRALEDFAQDVRMANNIVLNSPPTSLTLTVPDNYTSNSNQVTYFWGTTSGNSLYHYFYRRPGNATSTSAVTTYIGNVTSLAFNRYDRLNAATTSDTDTKRVQLSMTITSTNSTVVSATDTTLSASFVLRNKATN